MTGRQLALVAALLAWYSAIGHLRVADWTSELTLWTRAVAMAPEYPRPHINRAKALFGLGRVSEALREIDLAIQGEDQRGEP